MNSEKHYNANYLADTGNLLAEIKRSSYDHFSGLEGAHILDLGCGTGLDVRKMAEGNPQSHYTGVDHDQTLLAEAAKPGLLKNLDYKVANVHELPFDDESINGIRSERLFQHLKDEGAVWQEMIRVSRPGSSVMILETDWSSLNFYTGLKKEEEALVSFFTDAKINNGLTANRLVHSAFEWGLTGVEFEIYPIVLQSLVEANLLIKLEEMIGEAVTEHYLAEVEGQRLIERMARTEKDKVFKCTLNMINLSGAIGPKK